MYFHDEYTYIDAIKNFKTNHFYATDELPTNRPVYFFK